MDTEQTRQSAIQRVIACFIPKNRHKFDKDNPIYKEVANTGVKIEGYKCLKCGTVLWLYRWQLSSLPRSMKFCPEK